MNCHFRITTAPEKVRPYFQGTRSLKVRPYLFLLGALLSLCLVTTACSSKKPYRLKWERGKLDGVGGSPIRSSLHGATTLYTDRSESVIYVGTRGGRLIALAGKRGKALWQLAGEAGYEAPAAVSDRVLYLGNLDGSMVAVERQQGELLWEYQGDAELLSQPVIFKELVIFGDSANTVVALNRSDGSFAWKYREDPPADLTLRGTSTPVIASERGWLFVGFSGGVLAALEAATGRLLWRQQIASQSRQIDVDATPLVLGERVYVASVSGPLVAMDLTGNLLWSKPQLRTQLSVQDDGEHLFVATLDSRVYALDMQDGNQLWECDLAGDGRVPTSLLIDGNHLLVALSDGRVAALSVQDGNLLWQYKLGRQISGRLLQAGDGFVAMNGAETLFYFSRR